MVTIDKIRNGEGADVARNKINANLTKLSKNSDANILALHTNERLKMPNDYLRDGLIVYDIDLKQWFQCFGNSWIQYVFSNKYDKLFQIDDWDENITLHIPYETHMTNANSISVFMLIDNKYVSVIPDIEINNKKDIVIYSDVAFNGEVIIT